MNIHLFGSSREDARSRQMWELLSRSAEADPSVAVSAYYGGDRRGPKVSFRISGGAASAIGQIKASDLAIGRG